MIAPFLHRLLDERGVTVPLSMFVISLMVLLGGISLRQAVFTSDESNEDRARKRAIQAADAGIDAATYRMNMFDITNQSSTSKCIQRDGASGQLELAGYSQVGGASWCPPPNLAELGSMSEDLGDGASFSYYVSPEPAPVPGGGQLTVKRTVVSTGTANGQTRRVAADVETPLPAPLFGNWAVSSKDPLAMLNNAIAQGSVRSNKGITLDSQTRVECLSDGSGGLATPGPGYSTTTLSSSYVCGSKAPAAEPFTLSPVNVNLTQNDNNRICNTSLPDGGDPCTSRNDITWNPTTRYLKLDSNSTLTLGGSVYSFCYLGLASNSKLIIPPKPAGSSVRIYIEKSADCPGVSESRAMFLDSNSTITNQNGDPQTLQIYVEGNKPIEFNSNSNISIPTALYAPESNVLMKSNTQLLGAVAANQVTMDSNARVIFDPRVANIATDGVFPLMSQKAYRECQNPAPSAAPDSGC